MLETRDLVKHYHVGREAIRAVDGVSLSIAAGEFVAIYGPSGSGKSTLIDLVAGFQAPDEGTVLVDGRDIAKLSENEHAEYLLRVLGIVGHVGMEQRGEVLDLAASDAQLCLPAAEAADILRRAVVVDVQQ